jgi:hypothetical protein
MIQAESRYTPALFYGEKGWMKRPQVPFTMPKLGIFSVYSYLSNYDKITKVYIKTWRAKSEKKLGSKIFCLFLGIFDGNEHGAKTGKCSRGFRC